MIVRNLLASPNFSTGLRAENARALARAYLQGEFAAEERNEAEQALFALLDDPSELVRRALAESLAGAEGAPPGVVLGLACDQLDIAALVLSRSPLLTDAQLIDCAALGESAAQTAIALRPRISAAVAAALAEIGSHEALMALAANEGANLPAFALRRMIERFGADGQLREALLGRAWLPASVRAALAAAAARRLTDFAVERHWLSRGRAERVAKDSADSAFMIIAAGAAAYSDETASLAAYLRVSDQLTAGLALRALLCGQTGLFEATLVELTGLSPRCVADLIKDPASKDFAAVYAEAGLPEALSLAFQTALTAQSRLPEETDVEDGALRLTVIQAVLRRCETADKALAGLIPLLRRFETEAAREKGRRSMTRMKQETSAQPATMAPTNESEIAIDLTALEKDLIAA
jgi:uncharacterized protein (DUF2336 family)